MKYEYMISPFEFYIFDEFTKQEAKEYYEWYINQLDCRIDYLKWYIMKEGNSIDFDYSPESLIALWQWYEKKIVLEKKTEEEIKEELEQTPGWLCEFIEDKKLSYETIGICVDIAIYFAETLIRNTEGKLKWGYFTKPANKVDVNRPVVLGFAHKMHLNPIRVIYNCTWRSSRELNATRLYEMYQVWMGYIE